MFHFHKKQINKKEAQQAKQRSRRGSLVQMKNPMEQTEKLPKTSESGKLLYQEKLYNSESSEKQQTEDPGRTVFSEDDEGFHLPTDNSMTPERYVTIPTEKVNIHMNKKDSVDNITNNDITNYNIVKCVDNSSNIYSI